MRGAIVPICLHTEPGLAASDRDEVFGALACRRIMGSWLERSLENLKAVAERAPAQRA